MAQNLESSFLKTLLNILYVTSTSSPSQLHYDQVMMWKGVEIRVWVRTSILILFLYDVSNAAGSHINSDLHQRYE
jgi:hypothetical protein